MTYGDDNYQYNANGDMTAELEGRRVEKAYGYDSLGRLTSVTLKNGRRIDYVLDALGRRVARKVNGRIDKYFVYQSALQVAAELDSRGQLTKRFVYGIKSNVPDQMITSKGIYRIISDHLGSPRMVVDSKNDNIIAEIIYDEFGNEIINTDCDLLPFGYAGGLVDHDTKLVHFGAREYSPEVGRFLSRDPLLFGAGSTNLMSYAANDPVNSIDSSGTDSFFVTSTNPFSGTLPGHTSLVVDDPINLGKFRVFDFFPTAGLSNPFGPGTARERTLSAAEVTSLGSFILGWKKQSSAEDAATILRAQGLADAAKKGDLRYDPFNLTGLNCIGFGAAAK